MITIRVDRKTGESAIIDSYPAEGDDPFKAVAMVIADFAIKHGFVKIGQAEGDKHHD
jgi:hypothetical protein